MNLSQKTGGNAPDKIIKSMAKSPLFIAALSAFAVSFLLSLINMFTGSLARDLYSFADFFGFEKAFHTAVSSGDAGRFNISYFGFWQVVGALLTIIPGVIMAFAVFKLYSGEVNKGNLSLVKRMMTVDQIICCVSLGVFEMLVLMMLGNITAGSLSDAPKEVGTIFTVLAIGAFVIYITALFFCNSIKRTVEIATGYITGEAVVCDITLFAPIYIAVIGLITIVLPLFTGNILLILSSVLGGASHILFGYIIYDFRKNMLATVTY